MAKMEVGPAGIETMSGSLIKPKKKEGHKCGNYLIATHRTAATTSQDCQRVYARKASTYDRTTPVTADELAARARFEAVSKAVALRRKDLMQISNDQAAFVAQKDTAGGKKTMTAYLWSVCGAEYDQQHGG